MRHALPAILLGFILLSAYIWLEKPVETPVSDGAPLCPGCNIVFVVVETVRADHVGAYGYGRDTTPSIDAIASEGFVFDSMYSVRGATWPSMASILTGMYPASTGVRENNDLMNRSLPTMASVLGEKGYRTAAFVSPNFCDSGDWGFQSKYCSQYDETGDGDISLTSEASKWVEANREEKLLILVHYFAPHRPYTPKAGYDIFGAKGGIGGSLGELDAVTMSGANISAGDLDGIISLYDGEIRFADSQIGEIYGILGRHGLLNKTVFIVTADHGEELYQHNRYFYHDCSIYGSVLHVPFIVKLPSGMSGRVREVAENIDYLPTVLDIVGAAAPQGLEGRSLAPTILGYTAGKPLMYALGERYVKGGRKFNGGACFDDPDGAEGAMLTITDGRWRYVYNPMNLTPSCRCRPEGLEYPVEEEELYYLAADPLELNNVAGRNPNVSEKLRSELLKRYPNASETGLEVTSEAALERLRSLGYVA